MEAKEWEGEAQVWQRSHEEDEALDVARKIRVE